jgi:hypothetical protein
MYPTFAMSRPQVAVIEGVPGSRWLVRCSIPIYIGDSATPPARPWVEPCQFSTTLEIARVHKLRYLFVSVT